MQKGELIIYKTSNDIEIKVKLANDTVWLDTHLIADLFDVKRPAIVKHIQSIYKTSELDKRSTCSILEQVASDGKKRKMNLYNLDMIISVGYRVNSVSATQFRQWATQRLKDYVTKGVAINKKRLEELSKIVQLFDASKDHATFQSQDLKGMLELLSKYTKSFVLLNQYDSQTVETSVIENNITYDIQYDEAKEAIAELKKMLIVKKEATDLFGNEKDNSFESSLKSITQTFDGQYLYPSIEEQAAHLLYFVIKNHSFTDGNKRIGAFLFVWFLEKNRHLFKKSGELKINDNGLIALALLTAQSLPKEKDLIIKLIINLLIDGN